MVLNEILLWVVIVDMVNGTIGGSIQVDTSIAGMMTDFWSKHC